MFGAILSVVGQSGRDEFAKEEKLVKMLAAIAQKVKAAKEKEVSYDSCSLSVAIFSYWYSGCLLHEIAHLRIPHFALIIVRKHNFGLE